MVPLNSKVWIAGHRGLAGSAIVRKAQSLGYHNLLLRTSAEVDLRDRGAVDRFLDQERPDYVFLAAAKVGGIHANNTLPATFIADNLAIQHNVIDSSYQHGAKKLLFLGSSCIYPKFAPQPISEDSLLTGALEPTNQPYAIAKIAGMEMCKSYTRQYGWSTVSLMPTNLYGPNDNFDLESSHVLPALLRKFDDAKRMGNRVVLWGSGSPMREFLHVDDLAAAAWHLMNHHNDPMHVNVGTGEDVTIRDLANLCAEVVGYKGEVEWDASKPDGTPRKLLDVSKIHALGWKHSIALPDGLRSTYDWYVEHRRVA